MRLLHTFDDQKTAVQFSNFLTKEGIENKCEIITNTDWGSSDYGTIKCFIWVVDEDQIAISERWLEEYTKNPNNPLFLETTKWQNPFADVLPSKGQETPVPPPQISLPKKAALNKGLGFVTLYLLLTCTLLFLYGELTSPQVEYIITNLPPTPIYTPPINKDLLYDYPQAYTILDKLISAYGLQKLQNPSELPVEGQTLLQTFRNTPYWDGIYDKVVEHLRARQSPWHFDAPLFEKIREGEIWRLFSPAILHLNVFHLFFNMIWLVILGKLIEEKLGPLRYIILILVVAAVSNTAQYLISGPNFIGISGVIVGMLGFIWARQRLAPWEGYNLMPGLISFMFFFIIAMLGIQIFAFFMQVYMNQNLMPAIANTAHIVGGITGALLGCMRLFSLKTTIKP